MDYLLRLETRPDATPIAELLLGRGEARVLQTLPSPASWRSELTGGLPSVRIRIDGRPVTAVADTGARSCFAAPDLLDGAPATGRTRDFFPTFGAFETDLRQVEIGIDGRLETVQVAQANDVIVAAMAAAGARAIVGTDLMQRLGPTRLSFAPSRLFG
jgi:hypothetical protein